MFRDETAATRAFRAARDVLLEHREDLDAARAAFDWPRPEHFNWALEWFDVLARDNDSPALCVLDPRADASADVEVSYARMARRSDQVANWLRGLGVNRGDHVLVVLHNRVELWETLLALMKLGAVIVPTYTTTTPAELADRIERAGIRHVVAEAQTVPRFAGIGGAWTRVAVGGRAADWLPFEDSLQAEDEFAPDGPTRADAPLFRYFTSGTTSRPKMVEHTHLSYPVGHLSGMYWNGVRPGDRHLNVSAPGWAKHAWSSFFVPWSAEATVVALATPRPGPEEVLTALRTRDITTVCAPPTVWRGMINHGLGPRPYGVREATAVGESLEPSLFHAVHDAWGLSVRDGFGQTETTAQIGNPPGRTVVPGRMGWALPGYDLRLLDRDTGAEVPDGTPGELCVRLSPGPAGMMTGYAGDETKTTQAFRGGHYHTGDLVLRHEDGSYAYVSRTDDMFKSFDHRISPLELERALLRSPAVGQAAVVPVPHPVGLWQAKAYVVPARGHHPGAETARAVLAETARQLPSEKWVRLLEFTTDLPLTASGKIRRAELRTRTQDADAVHEWSGPEEGSL
ncbi:AMP-binding protein [Streptomyces endophyticus]|uniref:AMP-binding protein n=1 Tax=Streptomyces endophyticus TaxID=714166 RepID=A0ABU6F8D9_9ACTN|nr:AMP-binding protein [Streptomyces endophyticus]MEB8340259.1 AMP-binding protein [Streptomyces endophyticus]